MEWGSAIPPLIGTLIGGGITIVGQARADRRRESAEANSESRAAFRARMEDARKAVRELHDRVSSDIADIRTAVMAADDAGNFDRAEMLDPIAKDVAARHDRAASLVAVVSDTDVRMAADAVYDAWYLWIAAEVWALMNERENEADVEAARQSREKFAAAVRKHLVDLSDQEEARYPTA